MKAIGHTKNVRHHAKTKHKNVKFNFISSQSLKVTLEYKLTKCMIADPLTKPLDFSLFLSHVRALDLADDEADVLFLIGIFCDTFISIYVFCMIHYFWMVDNQ